MQKLLFLCAFSILTLLGNAQDKIITVNQDTIECRILSIGAEQICYEQKTSGGYMIGSSIPITQVSNYHRLPQSPASCNFFRKPERPWLFRISSGGSWMPWLFKDIDDISDDSKKLAKGFHLNASGHYLLTSSFGVGIQYSFFRSKANDEYPVETGNYYLPTYSIFYEENKQYINYVGTSLVFQQFLDKNKKFQLSQTLSEGIIFYRAENQLSTLYRQSEGYSEYNSNTLITGQTFGVGLGFSAKYFISPSFSIGIGADFLFGLLKKVEIEHKNSHENNTTKSMDLDKSLKISRLDYSLGLSFHF